MEAAIHTLRTVLKEEGHKDDLCCFKVDMLNAFNECDRSSVLERIKEDLPDLFPWVQWCYTSPGELRFGQHRILSTAGVQQGDPLGPLLFSLVVLQLLDTIGPIDGLILQVWYLDDGTFVGTRDAVSSFLHLLISNGSSFGLKLNLNKCEVFWPSGDQSFPKFPSQIRRINVEDTGVELLGSPVCGTDDFYSAVIGKRVDSVLEDQSLLPDLNNPQVELHLLRSCLSLCKINNLLRTVPPGITDNHWTRFDSGTRRFLEFITKASLPDASWLQATLPMRMGGLGLRQAATTSAAAFLGSCRASRELSTRLLVQNKQSSFLAPVSPLSVELLCTCTPISIPGEEIALVRYKQVLANYGVEGHSNYSFGQSQRALQRQLDDALLSSLKDTNSLRDRARLNTESSVHAAAWLRAIPNSKLGLAMNLQWL